MHSSGMRTARLLTVSQHALGVCIQGVGCLPGGVLNGPKIWTQTPPPPRDQRQTPPPHPWTDLWKHNLKSLVVNVTHGSRVWDPASHEEVSVRL